MEEVKTIEMKTLKFRPFPKLKTERLILRKLSMSDLEEVYNLRSDREVNKYIDRKPCKDKDEAIGFIQRITEGVAENKSIYWVICTRDDAEMLGSICLWNFQENNTRAELGYELLPQHQGKGYMSESLKTVLAYGFNTLNLENIEAYTHFENQGSKNLLTRKGFKYLEGKKDEHNENNLVFSLKASHYTQS